MERWRSRRCARTGRTGAGAATTRQPPRTRRSRSRSAARKGRFRALWSSGLLTVGFWGGQREAHPEAGVTGHRLHLDVPVVLVHDDAPGDVQPEPGALAHRLWREERLEYPAPDLLGYSRSGVAELDEDLVTVEAGAHRERSRPVHGRHRVVDQVRPHLVQLARVGRYRGQ